MSLSELAKKIKDGFHKLSFWFVFVLLCGMFIGAWGMSLFKEQQMNDAKLLGGMVIKGQVYSIAKGLNKE